MSVGGCRLLLESVSYKNSKIQSCLEVTGQVPIVVTGFLGGGGLVAGIYTVPTPLMSAIMLLFLLKDLLFKTCFIHLSYF